jgi:hypothetical protein
MAEKLPLIIGKSGNPLTFYSVDHEEKCVMDIYWVVDKEIIKNFYRKLLELPEWKGIIVGKYFNTTRIQFEDLKIIYLPQYNLTVLKNDKAFNLLRLLPGPPYM